VKIRTSVLVLASIGLLAACTAAPPGPSVPSLAANGSSTGPASAVGSGGDRTAALHAAAECIRQHGVPTYQDPVLDANGHVYTDSRSIMDAGQAAGDKSDIQTGLMAACGTLITAAGLQPADEPPAPPALIEAGVKAAECLRANGLPNYTDPTASTPFVPGHGFSIPGDALPNTGAGKSDPTVQRAFAACRTQLDAAIAQSSLTALAHD